MSLGYGHRTPPPKKKQEGGEEHLWVKSKAENNRSWNICLGEKVSKITLKSWLSSQIHKNQTVSSISLY